MNRAVTCNDRWQFVDTEDFDTALAEVPDVLAEHFRVREFDPNLASCQVWPTTRLGESFLDPVQSGAPVLLLSGGFDPRTPSAVADHVAQTLPMSQSVVVQRGAHGVSIHQCVLVAVLAFLVDPLAPVVANCGSVDIDFGG